MKTDKTVLADFCLDAIHWLEKQSDIDQAEVYASRTHLDILRLGLCSNVPSNGIEENKSRLTGGFSIRVLFKNKSNAFAKIDNSFSRASVERALAMARRNQVADPDFLRLPAPGHAPRKKPRPDSRLIRLDRPRALDKANAVLLAAENTFRSKSPMTDFNLTGELDFFSSQMAIVNSNGIKAGELDAGFIGQLTAILEAQSDQAGVEFTSGNRLDQLGEKNLGSSPARQALLARDPVHLEGKTWRVVFSPAAVADLLVHLFDPSLGSIDVGANPLSLADHHKTFCNSAITLCDQPHLVDAVTSKMVTDEGIATKPKVLIAKGEISDWLSDDYYSSKYPKMGSAPTNGFRISGFTRQHGMAPSIEATTRVVSPGHQSEDALIRDIQNGIWVGRIWYTYPVNGATSFDFTSTLRGNSWLIKNGEKTAPIAPNSLRINDNLKSILNHVVGLSKNSSDIPVWGSESMVRSPCLAVSKVRFERIAKGLY